MLHKCCSLVILLDMILVTYIRTQTGAMCQWLLPSVWKTNNWPMADQLQRTALSCYRGKKCKSPIKLVVEGHLRPITEVKMTRFTEYTGVIGPTPQQISCTSFCVANADCLSLSLLPDPLTFWCMQLLLLPPMLINIKPSFVPSPRKLTWEKDENIVHACSHL